MKLERWTSFGYRLLTRIFAVCFFMAMLLMGWGNGRFWAVLVAAGSYWAFRRYRRIPAFTLWLFLAIPVVLGSWWAVLCFLPYLPIIVTRILDEEKLLSAELNGYTEYKKKVKYHLIPFIW